MQSSSKEVLAEGYYRANTVRAYACPWDAEITELLGLNAQFNSVQQNHNKLRVRLEALCACYDTLQNPTMTLLKGRSEQTEDADQDRTQNASHKAQATQNWPSLNVTISWPEQISEQCDPLMTETDRLYTRTNAPNPESVQRPPETKTTSSSRI